MLTDAQKDMVIAAVALREKHCELKIKIDPCDEFMESVLGLKPVAWGSTSRSRGSVDPYDAYQRAKQVLVSNLSRFSSMHEKTRLSTSASSWLYGEQLDLLLNSMNSFRLYDFIGFWMTTDDYKDRKRALESDVEQRINEKLAAIRLHQEGLLKAVKTNKPRLFEVIENIDRTSAKIDDGLPRPSTPPAAFDSDRLRTAGQPEHNWGRAVKKLPPEDFDWREQL
jgi:hypothetical protein